MSDVDLYKIQRRFARTQRVLPFGAEEHLTDSTVHSSVLIPIDEITINAPDPEEIVEQHMVFR